MSDTEYDIDRNTVRTLWHKVTYRGSEIQVAIVGGVGKILDFGLSIDVRCPDGIFFPGDKELVLLQHEINIEKTGVAIEKYLSETADVETDGWTPPEGWKACIDEDKKNMKPKKCEVIHLCVGRRGG